MVRPILLSAVLTGLFCSGFAVIIDLATDMLERQKLILVSFASGFLGSLFAQTVLSRWRKK
ncbi:hypothetical protein [Boseongicola aestuarii]|uniref:Uncharacterized protein n=1 Tax=Boseongicola aestuarii TaxID=1470561 RepID=A0A238J1I3_9RHOB|nr:hypothetical protein [Boseongicola aestuarii]SMX24477.1 hypothetical protein BOA8489_02602 [Boseongicola aestuarii]